MAKGKTKSSRRILGTSLATPTSPLLKLPFEIREIIYRMLLTTQCTYREAIRGKITRAGNQQTLAKTTEVVSTGLFDLSPAILRVNKQIHAEATRILYGANEFIIVEIGPIYPNDAMGDLELIQGFVEDFQSYTLQAFRNVPAFWKFPHAKMTDPILRVTIALKEELLPQIEENWFILIITPEVMPRLFDALWIYGVEIDFYNNCFITLDFRNRNISRLTFLNEHILKIWDQIYGFGEVRLPVDMDAAVINHLEQPLALFDFEDELNRNLEKFQSIAESSYMHNDFATAYFYWYHLQRYWAYYLQVEEITHTNSTTPIFSKPAETPLVKALNVSAYKVGVSAFGILKILLRLRNYNLAVRIAKSPTKWLHKDELPFMWNLKKYTAISPILKVKFAFCCALALVAQGQYEDAKSFIASAVIRLRVYNDLYTFRTIDDISDEFCKAIDNELIHCGSRWRCGSRERVGPKRKGGKEWQLRGGCLPFWEWLEFPDEEPGPEYWDEDDASDSSASWE